MIHLEILPKNLKICLHITLIHKDISLVEESEKLRSFQYLRVNKSWIQAPGPGAYSVPSEFGDWDFPPPVSSKVIEVDQQLTLSNGFQQDY